MSTFEFVLVAFAIVIGFGISEILAGWGGQVRARHRLALYPLQIASSALVLFFSMQYLWGLWLLREVAWTFPLFLLVAAPGLILALVAHIARVDAASDAPSIPEQYFRNSRPVYSLLALIPIFMLLMSFIPAIRETVPNRPDFLAVSMIRISVFALIASIAGSRSERYHWIALSILWITAIGFIVRLTFRLVERAA